MPLATANMPLHATLRRTAGQAKVVQKRGQAFGRGIGHAVRLVVNCVDRYLVVAGLAQRRRALQPQSTERGRA